MPTVTKGKKKQVFPYTPSGEKEAASYAKKTKGSLTKKRKTKVTMSGAHHGMKGGS